MKSEALNFTIETKNDTLWFFLSGQFHSEQVPSLKEKIISLIEDGNKRIVFDLENVNYIDEAAVSMFVYLVNLMMGKQGKILFVFKNEIVTKAFEQYKNIFSIFPDSKSIYSGGLFSRLKQKSKAFRKKTGIRLSLPVAIILLVTLLGWILTLIFIIQSQSNHIHVQEKEIAELTKINKKMEIEIKELKERLKPLEQLGIFKEKDNNSQKSK
jgi:anti-anti-sigma factor